MQIQGGRRLAAILAADVAGYSRLMGEDEEGTLSRLKSLRTEIWDGTLKKYRGRLVKTTGDGFLVEFSSAVNAVASAVEIQRAMAERNSDCPVDKRIDFRVGINLGEVIDDDEDIFGDGVNIAARLESIAEKGGVCISRPVLDQIEGRIDDLPIRELGRQRLKNIKRLIEVYSINPHDNVSASQRFLAESELRQDVRYCTAPDGVRLAYATVGSGPPILRSAHWMSHLEYEWELPVHRHLYLGLAKRSTFIRYDARGNGMSDWDVGDITLDTWVSDMETVADAAGLNRFVLFGFSQGCAVSIAYAAKHPERVSHLILYGGFAAGPNKRSNMSAQDRERQAAMIKLMQLGWGGDDPTFRQLFTSSMTPTATREQQDAFNELQRLSASPECAVRYMQTVANLDVRSLLSSINVPTLVLHTREDQRVPIALGRELAAGIPNARFVGLPGRDHLPLEQSPGLPVLFEEIERFLRA
jgi:class 3 adenylate cyclase/pimeloyl-ACP methyl ester carboxylesterase